MFDFKRLLNKIIYIRISNLDAIVGEITEIDDEHDYVILKNRSGCDIVVFIKNIDAIYISDDSITHNKKITSPEDIQEEIEDVKKEVDTLLKKYDNKISNVVRVIEEFPEDKKKKSLMALKTELSMAEKEEAKLKLRSWSANVVPEIKYGYPTK